MAFARAGSNVPTGIEQLVATIEALRDRGKPDYDWRPTIDEPDIPAYNRHLRPCAAPSWTPPVGTVEEARELIKMSIAEYLSLETPAHMLLIKTLPGTGKTTAAVHAVDGLVEAGARRIGYAGPRHDFYKDVVAKTRRPDLWYEWLPRQTENESAGKIQTCNYTAQINEWMSKGYQGIDFCSGVCGWSYVNECIYHRQKKTQAKAVFVQHQHMTVGHPLEFEVMFGDESPVGAFTKEWKIPSEWIMPPGMPPEEPLSEILFIAQSVASNLADYPAMGPELLDMLGGAQEVLDACEMFRMPVDALPTTSGIHRPEEAAEAPYFHLPQLIHLLRREAAQALKGNDYPHRVIITTDGKLKMLLRGSPDERLPKHLIWMDATARPEIYRQLFGREVVTIDAQPHIKGKIFQVVDRANGKSALVDQNNGGLSEKARQAKQFIQRIIEDRAYRRPSIITYKAIAEDFGARTAHFYAARGTNAHEDADAIFVIGSPQPDIFDIVKMAKMIYFESDEAFNVVWSSKDHSYRYIASDARGRCYPVSGFWGDPRLEVILEVNREDEIIQSAHRARPVNHPVDIWLLTNIPIDALPPDELLTMRQAVGAPAGVNLFKWSDIIKALEGKDIVTKSDLVELGIHRNTASRYLRAISEMPGWELSVIKIDKRRGPPHKVARRRTVKD